MRPVLGIALADLERPSRRLLEGLHLGVRSLERRVDGAFDVLDRDARRQLKAFDL